MSLDRGPYLVGVSGGQDDSGHRTSTYKWRVCFTHVASDYEAILAVPTARRRQGHPSDGMSRVKGVAANMVGRWKKTGIRYDVDVEYSTQVEAEDFPWNEAAKWRGDKAEKVIPFVTDFNTGAAIKNAAGDRFLPTPETKDEARVYVWSKALLTIPETLWDNRRLTVNSGSWSGYDAKQVLFLMPTWEQTSILIEDTKYNYFIATGQILINLDGWNPHKFLNEGFRYKVGAKLIGHNADGTQITEPVALAADGTLGSYNSPNYIDADEFEETDFDALGLELPAGVE